MTIPVGYNKQIGRIGQQHTLVVSKTGTGKTRRIAQLIEDAQQEREQLPHSSEPKP